MRFRREEVIAGFCREYEYPPEAERTLLEFSGALSEGLGAAVLARAEEEYAGNPDMDFSSYLEELKAVCTEEKLTWETVSLLFYICLAPGLHAHYRRRRLPDAVCRDSLEDLKWKLLECRRVYGIWGSFVPHWFAGFFGLNRFTLGRLQFEPVPFPEEYERAGRKKPAGITNALYVHIPSGVPLVHEDCLRSYRLAAAFFRDMFPDKTAAFVCNSWLLFPEHESFLPPRSRILEFMKDFDIYAACPDPEGTDLWRIFGRPDCSDTGSLPEGTALQRAYKRWLLAGGIPGIGKGVFFMEDSGERG